MFKKFRGTKETGSASSTTNNNNTNTATTGNTATATATATGSASTGSSGQPRKQNTTRPPSGNVTRPVSTPTNSNSNSNSTSNSTTNSSDSRRPSSRLLLNKQKSTDRKTSAASWEEANDEDNKKHAQEERINKLESAINAFLTACRTSAPLDIIDRELCALRKAILFYGIPTTPKTATEASLRGRIWNIMLAVDNVDASSYMSLIARGKCDFPTYKKIRNDSFRTFQNDNDYTSVVKEPELIRCLNSFVLECHHCTFTNESHQPQQLTFTYVQGLNTVCAPLLYCMPEVEAYAAFCKIATKLSPWYWTSSHIGVQAGCKLLDQCLEVLDPELSHHLKCHRLEAYVYAFHCVSSLSASIPPFKELVKLWDFLLAFGPHFNILCVAAQIISFRDSVLQSDNPKRVLDYRTWPRLRARYVISIAMQLLPKLPADLYHTICLHATDQATVEKVTGRRVHDVEK